MTIVATHLNYEGTKLGRAHFGSVLQWRSPDTSSKRACDGHEGKDECRGLAEPLVMLQSIAC